MREVPGTNPYEFGIIARAVTKKSDDNILMRNKKINDEREHLVNLQNAEYKQNLRINFFEQSDKKAKMLQIDRNVQEIMNQRNFSLFERRKKLKQLFLAEEALYEKELLASAVTPLERAAQLRQRAKEIKEQRERENAMFVQEKLDQKWRSECDELRTFQSKQIQSGMREEHLRQIEEKICRERHRLEEEAVFADLWYQDIQAKKNREDAEARKKHEQNMHMSNILREQMQVLEKQKEEEKRLRNENVKLLHEKQNIEKLEKQMLYQKKVQDQANRRAELDQLVKAKLMNEARKAQEELSYDLKALEESLQSYHNEDLERAQRKQELLREQQQYREYLRQEYEEEKKREKELERILDEEVERQFQKRLAQWKAERMARRKLLEQVLKERQAQINEKLMRNEQRQQELELEKLEAKKLVEYYKQQEAEEKLNHIQKLKRHGQDLTDQMQFNNLIKKEQNDEKEYENRYYQQKESDYHKRLNDTMNNLQLEYAKKQHTNDSGFCNKCKQDLKLSHINHAACF